LINHINIIISRDDGSQEIKAFHSVVIFKEVVSHRAYTSAIRVAFDEDLRTQVIEAAMAQIRAWQDRFREYSELQLIFEAIERTELEVIG
jgi:hypothetical protein